MCAPVSETSVHSDLLTQIHEQALNTQGTKKTTPEEKSASSIDQMSSEQKKRLIMTYGVESDEDNWYPLTVCNPHFMESNSSCSVNSH